MHKLLYTGEVPTTLISIVRVVAVDLPAFASRSALNELLVTDSSGSEESINGWSRCTFSF